MNHAEFIETNEQAFRRMKATLDARFPVGHLIAFDGGEVIADAASVQELRPLLIDAGKNPSKVFVVQAGAEYPQFATILLAGSSRESRVDWVREVETMAAEVDEKDGPHLQSAVAEIRRAVVWGTTTIKANSSSAG